MKKILAITLVCLLVLPFLSVQAVSAQGPKTIYCDQMIVYPLTPTEDPHWIGTLSGCGLAGTVEFWETPSNFVVGKTEHYFEIFKITTPTGIISGWDNGVWNFSTFKFRAEGRVTAADGEWADLVGYKLHEMGTTTDPNDPTATAIYGPSTMSLTP
jgi:hypothetical protein